MAQTIGKLFGATTKGEAGFLVGGATGTRLFFFIPSEDPSQVYSYQYANYTGYGTAYGKGRWLITTFTASVFYWNIWNGRQTDSTFPKFAYFPAPSASTVFPLNIRYSDGLFMAASYINDTVATAGDVWTSTDGWTWTHYPSVLPADTSSLTGPVHNPTTNVWMNIINSTNQCAVSSDNGATWTTPSTLSVNPSSLAYGGGTWIAPNYDYNTNQIAYSTNDGSSWSNASTGSIFSNCYIRACCWSEYDQQFLAAGGYYNGTDFDARIASSPDGINWTVRENGSKKLTISNICADDRGNYVAIGQGYSGSFIATTTYLYSTDSGVTWNEGTLPVATAFFPGWNSRITWGDPKDLS